MPVVPHSLLDSLGDQALLHRIDPHGMLGLVQKFPAQCREAMHISLTPAASSSTAKEIRQVVLTGLGGSAIGGDFARCFVDEFGSVPMIVNRDYSLPGWIGPHTLVVAASYSGNTEETLQAYSEAKAAGAQQAVITSGGKLRALAERDGVPMAIVPGGQPPRSATGYMFFPLMNLLISRGILEDTLLESTGEMLKVLQDMSRRLGPDVPVADNSAKQMAASLQGKLPIIYGSQGYRGTVAMRWKGQFNENAKQAAFANVLPEQNHIEALAWVLAQNQAHNWAVVFLRDPAELAQTPRIARRVEITKEIIGAETPVHEVWAEGNSLLARLFSLVYFADYMSVYLAYLNDICPTDMETLEYLKSELAKLN